jgi:hypothetical protein
MGLLAVTGNGTEDDPSRYVETVEGAFDPNWVPTEQDALDSGRRFTEHAQALLDRRNEERAT